MSRLRIRPIEYGDMPFVIFLEHKVFKSCLDANLLRFILKKRSSVGSVACLDGVRVGFSITRKLKNRKSHERRMFLDSLAVLPEYRRTGVGTALLRECYRDLHTPITMIETYVEETNLAGLLFLRNCGWIATEMIREKNEDFANYIRVMFRTDWLKALNSDPPKSMLRDAYIMSVS